MRNFRKLLGYLWPHRGQIALIFVCAGVISVLWAGGLAALLPGAKILLSPEGLHGWAHRLGAERRLEAGLRHRSLTYPVSVNGQGVGQVLEVAAVRPGSRADRAGLREGDYLVGMEGLAGPVGSEALARHLAAAPAGREVVLTRVRQEAVSTVSISAASPGLLTGALLWSVNLLPEPGDYAGRFPLLLWLLVLAGVLTMLRTMLQVLKDFLASRVLMRTTLALRRDIHDRSIRLPCTYYSGRGVNDTVSRFLQDAGEVVGGQGALLGTLLSEPARAAAALAVALALSWHMTLLAVAVGPAIYALVRLFGKAMRKASGKALAAWSDVLGLIRETLAGLRVIKVYTAENDRRRRFLEANRRLLASQFRMLALDVMSRPALELLGVLSALAVAALAGYLLLASPAGEDPESFLALLGCLTVLLTSVRTTANTVTGLHRVEAAAARVREVLEAPPEPALVHGKILPRHSRNIQFRGVRFRYEGRDEHALAGIDLDVQAGEMIALVGPNGAGKTTLVSLLPRLLEPAAGQVLIDGHDLAGVSLRSLRRQIAMVSQDEVIFRGTLAENIAFGRRRVRREQILQAGAKAFLDDFIPLLPNGYDTVLSESGLTLSGGQRQRICLARAILRDPAILIFDEAMSQVDSESESRIRAALADFVRGRTTFVVAHRFATVLAASRIVVMADGRIVDIGPHDQLLHRCELYRTLYVTQMQGPGARD